jgi:hypothetical protein
MRSKLLMTAAAGLALLTLPALAQAPPSNEGPPHAGPGGPPHPTPLPGGDDEAAYMGQHHRHHLGPRGRRPGPPPPRGEAEQPRLSPAIHLRRGELVLDLDCSVRDSIQECAEAALRLVDRLDRPAPPRP